MRIFIQYYKNIISQYIILKRLNLSTSLFVKTMYKHTFRSLEHILTKKVVDIY